MCMPLLKLFSTIERRDLISQVIAIDDNALSGSIPTELGQIELSIMFFGTLTSRIEALFFLRR